MLSFVITSTEYSAQLSVFLVLRDKEDLSLQMQILIIKIFVVHFKLN